MLLRAASAVGIAVGIGAWRWYCRRHHQGFEDEDYKSESPREQVRQVLHYSLDFVWSCTAACSDAARSSECAPKQTLQRKAFVRYSTARSRWLSLTCWMIFRASWRSLEEIKAMPFLDFPRFSSVIVQLWEL